MNKQLSMLIKELNIIKNISDNDISKKVISSKSEIIDWYDEYLLSSYIGFQQDTNDKEIETKLNFSQKQIKPLLGEYKREFNKILYRYLSRDIKNNSETLLNILKNEEEIFSINNYEMEQAEDDLVNDYLKITSKLLVYDYDNHPINVSDLYGELYSEEGNKRKQAFLSIASAYLNEEKELNKILDELIKLRIKKSRNSLTPNFIDYTFKKLNRNSYTPLDCENLSENIKKHLVPLKIAFQKKQLLYLNQSKLEPWDSKISSFTNIKEKYSGSESILLDVTKQILSKVDPYFESILEELQISGNLDLMSRANKAGGGFSEFLPHSKKSFIFMNTFGTHDDLVVLLHEVGHAIHHDLIKDIDNSLLKKVPMEIAEFSAMAIELITMDYWDIAFTDDTSLINAKLDQFRAILDFLPLTIIVDQFQHWIYSNPNHSYQERNDKFKQLLYYYDDDCVDWSSFENWAGSQWLSFLHIFEVPFYYIEYAIAQIAALMLYKNYKTNPTETLMKFKSSLAKGNQISILETFKQAGINFDFSENSLSSVADFIKEEIQLLENELSLSRRTIY